MDNRAEDGGRARMHGVNPKRWFYQFNDFLAARPEQTARVLCGPSAERWMAAEMYGYLGATLPLTLTCYGEDGTTDVTVYKTSEMKGVRNGVWSNGRVASIEFKLVYRGHSETAVRSRSAELCRQVLGNRRHLAPMNVGYIYGVFTRWPGTTPRVRADFSSFRRDCGKAIRAGCGSRITCAKPAVETVIDERVVTIGGVAVTFGLVGQYLLPT